LKALIIKQKKNTKNISLITFWVNVYAHLVGFSWVMRMRITGAQKCLNPSSCVRA